MKSLRALRTLTALSTRSYLKPAPPLLHRLYSAEHQQDEPATANDSTTTNSVFDSSQFSVPNIDLDTSVKISQQPTWDVRYRKKVDKVIFGKETQEENLRVAKEEEHEEEGGDGDGDGDERERILAKALLEAALQRPEDEEGEVKEEDQKSLTVGIIGAPNAGKSALTNYLVGTKVAAVSRKTNTTSHEVLGVMTEGDTQVCLFDTPGVTLKNNGFPYKDMKVRVQNVWSSIDLYDVLLVIVDVHRHLTSPDSRVLRLIEHVGAEAHPKQKRLLCMNKVDLVPKKKQLLTAAEQFKKLPGYERVFMISGLKGFGVKDLTKYFMEQAIKRPWDEDPFTMSEEVMKNISMEVVREKLLDHVHQEIPYSIEHRLMDWKLLRDGSLRIEQHLITTKPSQRKILVGKNGSKIGRIGMEANEELRSIFKSQVHLILQVRLK